ncbi:MAG: hypothetical protein IJF23_04840, partial [Clostridia bacterium]|nr:hypothetical protein [Clostridia bacterium]
DGGSMVMQEIAAGQRTLDLIDSHATNAGIELYKAGILVPVDDIPNINGYDEKYGPLRFRQYGIFDGKLYGLYQYLWDFPPEFFGTMTFNVDMLSSLGISLPYEYTENGEWTWDNYKDYLMSIDSAARSAGYDSNFVAHTAQEFATDAIAFMFMNGCKFIEKDANGNYFFGLDNSYGMAALDFLRDLRAAEVYAANGTGAFIQNQNAAILTSESYHATHFQEGNESAYLPGQPWVYGLVNYPVGPNGDENCVSAFVHKTRRLNWVIGYSGNDLGDIGIFLDRLFEPIDDQGGWKGSLGYSVFHDTRDFDNYNKMLENVNYVYDLPLLTAYDNMKTSFGYVVDGKRSAGEAFDSIRSSMENAIKENVNWVVEDLIEKYS